MKPATVNSRWDLILPDQIADWDAITGWEFSRFDSMEKHLERGMTLVDVGTEHGWISAVYGREFVGPENMVLIEPGPEMWVNIRKTWQANDLAHPKATWVGFASASTETPEGLDYDDQSVDGWPACAYNDDDSETPAMPYRYLSRSVHNTRQVRIDDLGVGPIDAITVDVEGAELHVMRGASGILNHHRPLVWISIHPDLMWEHARHTPGELLTFMAGHGYRHEHLGTDHEQHWLFTPNLGWRG